MEYGNADRQHCDSYCHYRRIRSARGCGRVGVNATRRQGSVSLMVSRVDVMSFLHRLFHFRRKLHEHFVDPPAVHLNHFEAPS